MNKLKPRRHVNWGRILYIANLAVCFVIIFALPASAATDMWAKAKDILKDVYNQILGISTLAAIVSASIALILMNFSRNGRTVDESRVWLKRICISWAVLNGLGFIMTYVTPFFSGGQYLG